MLKWWLRQVDVHKLLLLRSLNFAPIGFGEPSVKNVLLNIIYKPLKVDFFASMGEPFA